MQQLPYTKCAFSCPADNWTRIRACPFRNNRITETGYIYALFLHLGGKILRQFRIIKHHSTNRALSWFDVKTGSQHPVTEIIHIIHQLSMQSITFFQYLKHFQTSTDNGRSYRIRE